MFEINDIKLIVAPCIDLSDQIGTFISLFSLLTLREYRAHAC